MTKSGVFQFLDPNHTGQVTGTFVLITFLSFINPSVIYVLGLSPSHTDEIYEVRK